MSRRGQCGYSLIEILAAVAILAIAVLPLMGMFTAAMRSAHYAQMVTQAAFHGQALMEEVVAASGSTFEILEYPVENPPKNPVPNAPGFTYTRQLYRHRSTGLVLVEVVIYWHDGQAERSYRVVTLIE